MLLKDFRKQLSSRQPQELPSLYIFTGPAKLVSEMKEKGVQALASALIKEKKNLDKTDLQTNIDIKRYDWNDFDEANFWNEVYAVPFLNKPKLVVLNIADKKGFINSISKSLEAYLSNKSFFTKLVILIDELKELSTELYNLIGKKAYTVDFPPMSEDSLPEWIIDEMNHHGKKMARPDARFIVEKIGNNPGEIEAALQKLVLFHRDSKEISSDSVINLVDFEREYDVRELCTAIADKRTARALMIGNQLLKQGEPIPKILGYLRWFFGYAVRYQQNTDLLSFRYEKILEADVAFKTGLMSDEMAFQMLIIKLSY